MTRRDTLYNFSHHLILVVFATISLIGCATTPLKEVDHGESLRIRAQQYWEMRMKDRYEESYKMEDREGLLPYNEYRNKAALIRRINIRSHSIKGVTVDGNNGIVDVEFSLTMPPVTKPFKEVIKDRWVYRDGKWWHRFN